MKKKSEDQFIEYKESELVQDKTILSGEKAKAALKEYPENKDLALSDLKNRSYVSQIMSLSCGGASFLKDNLICALAKLMYPGKIYSYGGLIYPENPSHTKGYDFLHQTRLLMKLGFDGVKMLEGKPDTCKRTGLPLDSTIYDEFFSYLEAASIPITYHVGDLGCRKSAGLG